MKSHRMIMAVLCLLSGPFSLTAQDRNPELEVMPDSIRLEYKIPAIAAAIIKPGKISYGITGQNKAGAHSTLTSLSKFHLGSNTKAKYRNNIRINNSSNFK
jgi:CubicO group peptidase (beta-lactamase class C family)